MNAILLGTRVAWSFQAPSGEVIVPGKTKDLIGYDSTADSIGFTGFSLESPEQGKWTVMAEASTADSAVEYGVLVEADGPVGEAVHLEAITRDSDPAWNTQVEPGTTVYVRTFVVKGGRPVPGVQWEVAARTPTDSLLKIRVFDDGRHADGAANDGIYVGALQAEGPDGLYSILAQGKTPAGVQQTFDVRAGQSRRIVTTWTPSSVGDYVAKLTIDPFIEPYETDYANNTRRTRLKVR